MNKLFTSIAAVSLGLTMAIGVGTAVGTSVNRDAVRVDAATSTITLVPNNENTGNNSTSYVTTHYGFDYENVHWSFNQWNPKTLQIKTNQGTVTNEFNFFTGVFPGSLRSVVITFSALTVSNNSGFKLAHKNSAYTSAVSSGGDTMTWNSSAKTLTWSSSTSTDTAIAFYQNGKVASGTNYIDNVAVTYETSGSSSTVASVSISGAPSGTVSNVEVGSTGAKLTASATMRTGTDTPTFTWSSSNESAVTVDSTGQLSYVGDGEAIISATASLPAGGETGDTNVGTVTVTTENLVGGVNVPFNVTQALAKCASTATTYDCYTSGTISRVDSAAYTSYGNKTFWISIDGTQSNELEVYRCLYFNGEKMSEAEFNNIQAGDTVTIVGKLVIYNETKEYSQGCYLVTHTKPVAPRVSITESSQSIDAGETLTLHATVENPVENYSINWVSSNANILSVTSQAGLTATFTAGSNSGSSDVKAQMLDSNEQVVAESASITITVTAPVLSDGDVFIIKAEHSDTFYYLTGVASNLGTTSTTKSDALILTAIEGETEGQFQFKNGNNYLSYHGSSNNLYTTTESDNSTYWTATDTGNGIIIESVNVAGRKLQYNYNNGNPRFCCYTSSQTLVEIELTTAPEVKSVTVAGDSTADAGGASSITKDFLYEVTYEDITGNYGITVTVLNSNEEEEGASVTSQPSDGSFSVTFTISDTYTVSIKSTEDPTKTDSTTIVVSNIYVPTLTDFNLYSGTTVQSISSEPVLVEGDYVIYYGDGALKASITSDRADYAVIAPADNKISTDNASIMWHIARSGDYYTIKSLDTNTYLAGTGVKNKIQLLTDGTDDKSLWSVSISEGTFEFVNKANTAGGVNAHLRKNGDYGFACYATGTGGALSLYRKASTAVEFARKFVDDGVCTLSGASAPTSAKWNELNYFYQEVSSSEKLILVGFENPTEYVNPSTDEQYINEALYLYDYAIQKYNKQSPVLEEFISGRDVSPLVFNNNIIIGTNSDNIIPIIVIVSLISVSAIGGYFYIRRRKEQ